MSYKVNIVSSRTAVMSTIFYWPVRPLWRGLLYYRQQHQPGRERMSEVVVINHQIKWHFSAVTAQCGCKDTQHGLLCGIKGHHHHHTQLKAEKAFYKNETQGWYCSCVILVNRKSFGTSRRDIFITVCTSFWYLLHVREKCLLFVLVSHISITLD